MNVKKLMRVTAGFISLFIGIVFILLPGPAIIFLPLGLALLSTEFNWAEVWLKRCQRWMRKNALSMDKLVSKYSRKYRHK